MNEKSGERGKFLYCWKEEFFRKTIGLGNKHHVSVKVGKSKLSGEKKGIELKKVERF